MATGTSALTLSTRVSSVPVTVDFATRVNIKKRREQVVYKAVSTRDNINLSYLIGEDVKPSTNLFISDRSTSLVQNRVPLVEEQVETTSSITLQVDKFLVTDVFTVAIPSRPATPLFFVHTLKNFNSTNLDFSDKTLVGVEFTDENLKPREVSAYTVDKTTGEVFNNIDNTLDPVSLVPDITFVKYTVRQGNGADQTVKVHHELIDNVAVFEEADFDDVDAFGNILTGLKKYLIEVLPGGQQFLITLPETAKYAYKEDPQSRIRVLSPTALNAKSPWNVRILNGKFITSLKSDVATFTNYTFRVAEFNSQSFSPSPPYRLITEERATWITPHVVKVARNVAVDTALSLFIDVVISNKDDTVLAAFTSSASKNGSLYSTTNIEFENKILSEDRRGGFIELDYDLLDTDKVDVTYYTKAEEYEFTAIDFNPINNVAVANQRVVVYITPESTATGDLDSSLYYLVVNPLGEILYSSQADENSEGLDAGTVKMLDEDFTTDGIPTHRFYYDIESTTSGLETRASGLQFNVEGFSWIDKYSVESALLNPTATPSGFQLANMQENPHYLVLADIFVGEHQSPGDLSRFDVRVEGGGIKDDKKSAATDEQPEVGWYWDIGADRPFPGAAAFICEVPSTVLDTFGGGFTRAQVTEVIDRHMQLGGYAILKNYGRVEPFIDGRSSASGEITACWPSYGADQTYNAYWSRSVDTGFSKWNTDPITDVHSGNCVTVTGLDPSTKYFVHIKAIEGDNEFAGPTVSITTGAVAS